MFYIEIPRISLFVQRSSSARWGEYARGLHRQQVPQDPGLPDRDLRGADGPRDDGPVRANRSDTAAARHIGMDPIAGGLCTCSPHHVYIARRYRGRG